MHIIQASTNPTKVFWNVDCSVTSKSRQMHIKVSQKMISLEKWKILPPLQKLPSNDGDLGKIIVATGFKKLPKVQYIAQSGHTCEL